ncbi:GNAT family N-acetyltransferase [Sphingobacterium cellulitidis]|uniref:GNAT family N-acetyltransferase n=1 Tax=Sphingobacterium cellulitidis TaxID=1768011 RepID=UPI003C7DA0AF
MDLIIRREEGSDFQAISELIKSAFENEEMSDHQEQFLVDRLRLSKGFIPDLALIAQIEERIVGYILLTKVEILSINESKHSTLALAPVAVLPEFHGQGIGSQLVNFAHQRAQELGYESVVLLGHEDYYPRFGYRKARDFDIKLPFDVPDENCMVIELIPNALQGVSGIVQYPSEFYE